MKKWTMEIEIHAPIEKVWKYFDGQLEDMQKVMPNVIEHTPKNITDTRIGSVYQQKYKEGKRIEEYEVETLEYVNTPKQKKLKVGFTLAKMFEITAFYELSHLSENKTLFRYTVTNHPLKWFTKVILFFANEREVIKFTERVKQVAEFSIKIPSHS